MAKGKNVFIMVLRVIATAVCFSAVFITATSRQTVTFFGIKMDAKYQYTPSLKFLVGANAVVSVYSLLVLFIKPTSITTRVITATDLLVVLLLTASISAAGSVSYVGKYGNSHAGWPPVCDKVPKYCDKIMGALICNSVGGSIYLLIVSYNIHVAYHAFLL